MKQRKLGRTPLHVSEICLGTTKFGWSCDDAAAFALLDAYHAGGGRFIQSLGFCRNSVTAPPVDSRSEEIVGRWHETRGIPRERLVLASRMNLFRPAHGGSIAFTNLIREACERSLRRLRTGHLDLLICEWDEHLLPIEDVLEAFDLLVRAGLIRHAVAGGFPPWRVVDALHRASARNHGRFEALQAEYSLLTRARFEAEALAMCREHRLGFLARSPLAGGFLAPSTAPRHTLTPPESSGQGDRFGNRYADAVRAVVADIASNHLVTPAQVALAWVLRNPHVSSAVVSAVSPQDLCALTRAANLKLSDVEVGALANVTSVPDHRMELRPA